MCISTGLQCILITFLTGDLNASYTPTSGGHLTLSVYACTTRRFCSHFAGRRSVCGGKVPAQALATIQVRATPFSGQGLGRGSFCP